MNLETHTIKKRANTKQLQSNPNYSYIVDTQNTQTNLDTLIYEKIKTFPNTRYYGSKRRLLPWLYDHFKELKFDSVLDGFGGTGSVSLLFKAMGKDVAYNDILTSNCISASVLLQHKVALSFEEFEQFVDAIKPLKGLVSNTFQGLYYTDEENKWLDGAISEINGLANIKHRNLFFHCLFQASIMKRPFNTFHRANLNLRMRKDITRSFGNLTTWNTPFPQLMKKVYLELYRCIWENDSKIDVLPSGPIEKIKAKYDLVYLDPPYVGAENSFDGYLKKYHFLEGITNYEMWQKNIDISKKNRMILNHQFNKKWENNKTFKTLLFDLIDKHRNSIVVLSYVTNAHPSIDELSNYFKENFSKTTISTFKLSHALSKTKKNEILIIGEP